MNLELQRQIRNALHNFMGAVTKGEYIEWRMPTLRASAFPYCPIIHASSLPLKGAAYRSDFYFKVGTAIHELMQVWASRAHYTPRLWGDWECTGCKARIKHTFHPRDLCQTCLDSGRNEPFEWTYAEVELEWNGLTGHVDMILEIAPGLFVVGDFKTTEFAKGGGANDRSKYPYRANVTQIQIYCTLLKVLFNVNIVGWALIYINRGKPIRGPIDYHVCTSPDWTDQDHQRIMRLLRWATVIHVNADRILQSRARGQRLLRADVQAILDRRPCTDEQSWRGWMKPKFYWERDEFGGPADCPHLEICTGDDAKQRFQYFAALLTAPAVVDFVEVLEAMASAGDNNDG